MEVNDTTGTLFGVKEAERGRWRRFVGTEGKSRDVLVDLQQKAISLLGLHKI